MPDIKILSRKRLLDHFFAVDKLELRFPHSQETITRYMAVTKEAAAVLVHRTDTDSIILIKQFRLAAMDHKEQDVLEIPAGVLEEGETHESCARRESLEETGYRITKLDEIGSQYASPGYTTEKYMLYYAPVTSADKKENGGGLKDEHEMIHVVEMSFEEAMRKIDTGEINDAKTTLALLWLYRRKTAGKVG